MTRPASNWHPTQIFMSNPQALRVEFCFDNARLSLWWSPRAGASYDCLDRNYSYRDSHLDVLEEITLPGCDIASFDRCDYDPYHSVLHFKQQTLHLALRPDLAAVIVWAEATQRVDVKAHRHDETLFATTETLAMSHREPRYTFEFAACLGPGGEPWQHCPRHASGHSRFASVDLTPGQLLVIGVGLAGDAIAERAAEAARTPPSSHLADTDRHLEPVQAAGLIRSRANPELEALRRKVVRGMHAMIDESGAYRASLKPIYYLIWVRDGGFSYPYQAGAGWPHKLMEFCRLLLDNPTTVNDPDFPAGRMFGQLINRDYGKLEEDGIFYVVWALFTHWRQFGHLNLVGPGDWLLLDEALAWVEAVTWDETCGLYGGHFSDETPTIGHRDTFFDYAIGRPAPQTREGLRFDGKGVVRNYDIYFNLLMHSTYAMYAAMRNEPVWLEKSHRVWPELERLLLKRHAGIPVYAEQLTEDGDCITVPHWGQGQSCGLWALTLPHVAPLEDWDAVRTAVMDEVIAKPEMHFMNGIASALAAVDPWIYPEERLLSLHHRMAAETNEPGRFLPMGGAMPEKFNAPQGNLYHDIRPQGFAMGTWLGAWAALGLRRLPYGLALRPTSAFETLENYAWRGCSLHVEFGPTGKALALQINGRTIFGTLQIPEGSLTKEGEQRIRLIEAPPTPLLLRSHVQLDTVEESAHGRTYLFTAFGLASISLSAPPVDPHIEAADGTPIKGRWSNSLGIHTCYFSHWGPGRMRMRTT